MTLNSWWIYVGHGEGQGERHKVISIDKEGIITWSAPSNRTDEGGHTWFGPYNLFKSNFKPA